MCGAIEATKTVRGLRDSALIQLMSDCMLRVSEAVAVNVSDVREKTLFVGLSKTDQEGEGVDLCITRDTRKAIRRYRDAGEIADGPLFRRILKGDKVTTQRITAGSARHIIKQRASLVGVDTISGHSMRIGSAISLTEAGASVVDLQTARRWRDPKMPGHYAAAVLAGQGAVARFKEGRPRGMHGFAGCNKIR